MNRFLSISMALLLLIMGEFTFAQKQSAADNDLNKLFVDGNSLLVKGYLNSTVAVKQETFENNANDNVRSAYFSSALAIWKKILEKNPNNADVNFKIGLCYYSSLDEQLKALPYFQKATKSMSMKYNFKDPKSGDAPYLALYFLAETFFQNNQPDSALKYFSLYHNQYEVTPISAEKDILMCMNARNSAKKKVNVVMKNLGEKINTKYAEGNPVVKLDNSMLFFSSRRPAKNDTSKSTKLRSEDIYISTKDASGNWEEPQAFQYNSEFDEAPLFITADGMTFYFRKTIKENTDIYYTKFVYGAWGTPASLTAINSKHNENGMCISPDGKNLYLSSDRKGTPGRYDLYHSAKEIDGTWDTPVDMGKSINTPYSELSPSMNPDGKTLYFSSNGFTDKGLGGYDVYYIEMKHDTTWTEPRNMGYPINKTRDDNNYYPSAEGKRYYSYINEDKSYDLFEIIDGPPPVMDLVAATNEVNVTPAPAIEPEVPKVLKKEKVVKADKKSNIAESSSKEIYEKKINKEIIPVMKHDESSAYQTIYFDFNDGYLPSKYTKDLKSLADYLEKNPEANVEIIGYSDNRGSWEANLKLSESRAKAVKEFLIKDKISSKRIIYYGKGFTMPLATNDSKENRSKNRRVEIMIQK